MFGGYNKSLNDRAFRIEKRYKYDGGLIASWVYNPSSDEDLLLDCAVANDMLYVVGSQDIPKGDSAIVILVLDQNLRLIKNITSNPTE